MKTEATPFYDVPVVADDAFVFEVRAGIPADLALDLATCQLDAAILTIRDAAGSLGKRSETSPLYTALYTLEQAYALCNSISRSVMRSTDDQSEGEQGEALHLDLTAAELAQLRAIAGPEDTDLSRTAARLLGAALRHHADVVAGNVAPKATEPESVCDLLADLDWYLSQPQHRALRRLADERYDGNLKLALASLFERALEELEGADQ